MTMSQENASQPVATQDKSVALWRTLAIVLAVALVAVVAFMMGRGGFGSAASSTPDTSSTQTAQSAATEQAEAPKENTQPQQTPEFAPSVTDENVLKLLRAEPKRDANDNRAVGKVDAPVVMVEFTDYSCPMCTKFAHETESGLQDLVDNGTLRIEYRDLVIFQQYGSDIAAAGGWAAAEQGKHAEYRKAVWDAAQGHPQYTVDSVVELAKTAGVPDLDKFRASVESADTKAKVDEQTQHAYSLGLTGTPFIMINDTGLNGAYPLDFVRRTIEEQAKAVAK